MRTILLVSFAAGCAIASAVACHGKLPPTQPPRATGADEPAMRTNDVPLNGPVATAAADPAAPAAPPALGAGGSVVK